MIIFVTSAMKLMYMGYCCICLSPLDWIIFSNWVLVIFIKRRCIPWSKPYNVCILSISNHCIPRTCESYGVMAARYTTSIADSWVCYSVSIVTVIWTMDLTYKMTQITWITYAKYSDNKKHGSMFLAACLSIRLVKIPFMEVPFTSSKHQTISCHK